MSTTVMNVRVSDDDVARLDSILADLDGATRGGLLRELVRIGLDAVERKPKILDGRDLDARGGAREGAGRKKWKKFRKGIGR